MIVNVSKKIKNKKILQFIVVVKFPLTVITGKIE